MPSLVRCKRSRKVVAGSGVSADLLEGRVARLCADPQRRCGFVVAERWPRCVGLPCFLIARLEVRVTPRVNLEIPWTARLTIVEIADARRGICTSRKSVRFTRSFDGFSEQG